MTRKSKHHAADRRTKGISISIPRELEPAIEAAEAYREMNRSQYLCWLAIQHIYLSRGQLPPELMLGGH